MQCLAQHVAILAHHGRREHLRGHQRQSRPLPSQRCVRLQLPLSVGTRLHTLDICWTFALCRTMSMKACRRDLEATLGLEPKALDVHKKLIERRVLSVCF